MKKSILLTTLLLFTIGLFFSCNSKSALEEKCENWNSSEEFQEELAAVNSAAVTYGQNPTKENCEAYKAAYIDYIDALREWEDCYIFYDLNDQYNQALDAAEEAANNIECN